MRRRQSVTEIAGRPAVRLAAHTRCRNAMPGRGDLRGASRHRLPAVGNETGLPEWRAQSLLGRRSTPGVGGPNALSAVALFAGGELLSCAVAWQMEPRRRDGEACERQGAHRRRRARGQARSGLVHLVAVTKTFGAERHRARARCRPPPVRREPRAGGQGQVAGAARALPRHRAAPDRPAAVQQGQGGRRSCSTPSTPSTGPRSPRPSPARWRGRAGACSSSSRSTPARSRRRPASCRRRLPASCGCAARS